MQAPTPHCQTFHPGTIRALHSLLERLSARTLLVAAVVASSLGLGGCAGWDARYRNTDAEPFKSVPQRDATHPFRLAFVEFSEQGFYHDARQIANAEKLIQKQQKPLVVTYIHGWHNNSASGDVAKFKDFLLRLSKTRSVQNNGFTVVGVYLGWNGESSNIKYLNTFSIWDRKQAAERLANNAHCLDALLRVGRAARIAKRKESYTVFMGHSLGANVLERTLAHSLLTLRYGGGGQMPCNLAIMLNQASGSEMTAQLMTSLSRRYPRKGQQYVPEDGGDSIHVDRPTIVSITSENDGATGTIYPVSAWVADAGKTRWATVEVPPSSLTPKERRFATEKTLRRYTLGHQSALVNFHVVRAGEATASERQSVSAFDANLAHDITDRSFATSEAQNYAFTEQKATTPPAQEWLRWRFVPTKGVSDSAKEPYDGPDVPYWNVRVPSKLIDSHGGIWSDNSTAMMAAIFRMHVPRARERQPAPTRALESTRLLPSPAPVTKPVASPAL